MGITTSSDGKDPDYIWETPRVNMGNTPSLSVAHIPVDTPLILLVSSGSSCQYVGNFEAPTW